METQRHCLIARTNLLRMTALTQKTVDYSVKAYELNKPEFTRKALQAEQELHAIELSISDRGRSLLAAGKLMDSTSPTGRCSLRIYSALRITHACATEMARNTRLKIEKGDIAISAATIVLANQVNSLVRLNTVAVFNRKAVYARIVLQIEAGRRNSGLTPDRVHGDLREVAIFRCLEQIAEQAREIADAVTRLLGGHLPVPGRPVSGTREMASHGISKRSSLRAAETKSPSHPVEFKTAGRSPVQRDNPSETCD